MEGEREDEQCEIRGQKQEGLELECDVRKTNGPAALSAVVMYEQKARHTIRRRWLEPMQ